MLPVFPDIHDSSLTVDVMAIDEKGDEVSLRVVEEKSLTVYLNQQEIVTSMTIGDHPRWLAVGYLTNQGMVQDDDVITGIDFEEDIGVVVVRTDRKTDYEERLRRKIRTSGCAEGTAFGDLMATLAKKQLPKGLGLSLKSLHTALKAINTTESLYLVAGALHGCVLCKGQDILLYMEDVGRHNAVDKICGYMKLHGIAGDDKWFFTTGRLTSEMVIKTIAMGIPILVSRSGFTAYGVSIAREYGLTLIGRAKGKRMLLLSGEDRIIFDDE